MSRRTTIIAEIGENHHGAWEIARKMMEEAAGNGADIVKFQSYGPEDFDTDDEEYDWFCRVSLSRERHFEFKELAEGLGVEFMTSPFSVAWAKFVCGELACPSVKIASSVMMHFDMLDAVNAHADTVKTVYISTGMATMDEVREAVGRLDRIEDVAILHCVTQYPARADQANLLCIPAMITEFPGRRIGYSDHVPGIAACTAAAALGATVLEKHFTFNTRMPGTDHAGAMAPADLARLREETDQIEQLLGTGRKEPVPEELPIRDAVRAHWRE